MNYLYSTTQFVRLLLWTLFIFFVQFTLSLIDAQPAPLLEVIIIFFVVVLEIAIM
jgi:hypothetical protein